MADATAFPSHDLVKFAPGAYWLLDALRFASPLALR
jgi:hypothetical protein